MSGTLINLIIQIIAGVVGGHAAGAALKNYTNCGSHWWSGQRSASSGIGTCASERS